ncbi:MAG: transketolase [Clostridiales bacterium GWC2_40_7]|nr:MAG: transketolase [Clostridiales bacterium GWC2_40_7]
MISGDKIKELEVFALKIRIETIKEIGNLGFGHLGGAMSIVDMLSVLYGGVMNIDPGNPGWEGRDWLVCSKGHAGPAIYATLALKGYFPKEKLKTLNKPGTSLPSHCDKNLTVGIDMTTGSLGQGSSSAVGIALGNRLDGRKNTTYLVLGDGELQEGQVWEAALLAAQQKLHNLIAFVDYNKQQLDGYTKDINDLGDLKAKFKSFGWYAQEVDGHNVKEIYEAVDSAKKVQGKPSVIILNTVKGKGCCFAEGIIDNHHMIVDEQQINEALAVLEEKLDKAVRS